MGLDKFKREYPSTLDEAFMSSQRLFYPTDVLDNLDIREMINTTWESGDWIIGDRFYMGVDVALGTGRDYSSIVIISGTTLQPVYIYRDNTILPENLAEKVFNLYHEYEEPLTIVEADGPGHTVLYRLKDWKVRKLYKSKNGKDWYTRWDRDWETN